ncbi:uncharacterized protein METZ01_LOCUS143527 [marine metagenome]|uniref:Uncharacterized protein n=1 Tax=marine metagenome TaxID=408172 RepID=A0A381ZPK7_9ZZZZ
MQVYYSVKQFIKEWSGESGIRTHGTRKRTHAFQACSLSHSDISPFILGYKFNLKQ